MSATLEKTKFKTLRIGFFGQKWPFLREILNLNSAVCWKQIGFFNTNNISLYLNIAVLVKVLQNRKCNQPVTNGLRLNSHLVGTSETIRATSFDEKNIKFNQWLAGLIDGDGSLLVSKKGYTSCEITVALADERMLRLIQNKLGGSIKLRRGVKAIRWRLHNKIGMLDLITRINGHIRHTNRFAQLQRVCGILGLKILSPDSLHNKHAWFAGFFDADGTIGYYFKGPKANPQLTISVTNKLYADVIYFSNILGGNIYYDSTHNGYYKWSIQSEELINSFLEYTKVCPVKSIKRNRLFLIKEYYRLLNLKAHKANEDTVFYKAWLKFNNKWLKNC